VEHWLPKSNLGSELITTLENISRKRPRSA
jgi:hypothetical protein